MTALQYSTKDLQTDLAVSVAAGVSSSTPNMSQQTRESFLVARVARAPFFAFVATNFLYVIVALVLGILTWQAASENGVYDIQARLSFQRMVIDAFEERRNEMSEKLDVLHTSKKAQSAGCQQQRMEYCCKVEESTSWIIWDFKGLCDILALGLALRKLLTSVSMDTSCSLAWPATM